MKHNVYTIYDCKAEAYLQPFQMQKKGQAIRAFENTVNDPNTQFHKHPADYTLFEIGEYDDSTGNYAMWDAKINLGLATEFLRKE